VFSLTESGRKAADERGTEKAPWDTGEERAPLGELRTVAVQVGAATRQVGHAGSDEQITRAVEVLAETRRRLYSILAQE
jgi:hypothetical protein